MQQPRKKLFTSSGRYIIIAILIDAKRIRRKIPMTGFQFSTEYDAEQYKSFSSLVKFNNGLFRSEKQAKFLLAKVFNKQNEECVPEKKNFFGIDILATDYVFRVEATVRWASYGSRSVIPVTWIFVADESGIKAQYKLKYNGNLRDGCSPAPEKTETLWVRPQGLELPNFFEVKTNVEQLVNETNFIGVVGKRVTFKGTIKSVREFSSERRFSYYDSGFRTQTVIEVDGSEMIYWNSLNGAKKGDVVEFTATVKQHQVYKDKKQTVISRASKVSILNAEEVAA